MYNEFNQHKKSDAIKWAVVFILIAVLFAGMIAALVMALPDKENTPEDQEITDVQGDGDTLSVVPQNTEVMTLRVSEPYYMASALAASGYTKSVDLTATIFPVQKVVSDNAYFASVGNGYLDFILGSIDSYDVESDEFFTVIEFEFREIISLKFRNLGNFVFHRIYLQIYFAFRQRQR